MSLIDYLLYDNRTEVRWGCDWGLKAATGALSSRADIKKNFLAYCDLSSNSSASPLSGFGHAIGGFPDGKGGYILCVTLENQDLVGRDSFSIIGLWFPAAKDLAAFLDTYGPLETASLVLDADSSRQGLLACGHAKPWVGQPPPWLDSIPSLKPFIVPFESNAANQALEYMRRKARNNRCPDHIFGVTSVFQLRGFKSYDLVFCFPGSVAAKLSLQDHLSKQEERIGKGPPKPVLLMSDPKDNVLKHEAIYPWLLATLLCLILFSAVFYFLPSGRVKIVTQEVIKPHATPEVGKKETPSQHKDSDSEKFISEVKKLVEAFQDLKPTDLDDSRTYQILTTVNIERDSDTRKIAKKILTDFKAIHNDIFDKNGRKNIHIAGFFKEGMIEDHGPEALAKEIALVLGRLEDTSKYCELLKTEFKFEATDPNTPLSQWCKQMSELATLKKQSQKFAAHQN